MLSRLHSSMPSIFSFAGDDAVAFSNTEGGREWSVGNHDLSSSSSYSPSSSPSPSVSSSSVFTPCVEAGEERKNSISLLPYSLSTS